MGDSDESWSGGEESVSSEEEASSEPEASDTDEEIKYTTHPTRGVRWRIGESSVCCLLLVSRIFHRWSWKTTRVGEDQGSEGKAKALASRRGIDPSQIT